MKLIVNGEERVIDSDQGGGEGEEAALPISELLRQLGLEGRPVLVEKNGEALLARDLDQSTVVEGDRIEILRMVAGG